MNLAFQPSWSTRHLLSLAVVDSADAGQMSSSNHGRRDTSSSLNIQSGIALGQPIVDNITTAIMNTMANATATPEDTENDVMKLKWLRAIFIIFYCVIFLFGITGNSLVVYVVVRNKSMQSITNIFITNLAVSDIMMCLLAVPFTPLSAFLNSWIFGDVLCHIVPMTLGVSVYVSTLTSTAIAIDR